MSWFASEAIGWTFLESCSCFLVALSHWGLSLLFYLRSMKKVFLQKLRLMKLILQREAFDFSCFLSQAHWCTVLPLQMSLPAAVSLREQDGLFNQKICSITMNLNAMVSVTLSSVVFWCISYQFMKEQKQMAVLHFIKHQ